MAYETITVDVSDKIATITLNRPERMNACSLDMAGEINDALSSEMGDARCLIITGAGRGFCSGADLQARGQSSISGGEGSYVALTRHYNPLMINLARLNMPVITAVNGAAAGVGCSIGLCGDFVIAGKSGYFLQAFVNIGLVPDGGASWMLPRLIGKARATEMMMLGEKISADKALDWGMIYKVVEDAELQAEARALATRLANGPTISYATMRKNILVAMENSYAEQLLAEAEGQRIAGNSADAMEGGLAFLEKRKPNFQGK
ncbi:enoyl-CoA hydratase-related protein [Novosphingobium sp.]|jgi:2-(1,2-epoxy-1,2-dihydrophenyl)acetyl-CoA isomerase|uniref:enoyl-CoA hydratase-related protein n=1 Tax=Novosphingobium sp. TaxID=1874826 RepID=UPI001EBD7900|nr:enoyl-CoA hydratase-related protein [Novosphingobium sp.]MBK6800919.1 enoyl-CoA hydratase/isomerase family protein [Novosphingobium sp.]MBK9011477.1 enoyl-CoA hydratase/isomerase family protein [Novosphingobium sp.]